MIRHEKGHCNITDIIKKIDWWWVDLWQCVKFAWNREKRNMQAEDNRMVLVDKMVEHKRLHGYGVL